MAELVRQHGREPPHVHRRRDRHPDRQHQPPADDAEQPVVDVGRRVGGRQHVDPHRPWHPHGVAQVVDVGVQQRLLPAVDPHRPLPLLPPAEQRQDHEHDDQHPGDQRGDVHDDQQQQDVAADADVGADGAEDGRPVYRVPRHARRRGGDQPDVAHRQHQQHGQHRQRGRPITGRRADRRQLAVEGRRPFHRRRHCRDGLGRRSRRAATGWPRRRRRCHRVGSPSVVRTAGGYPTPRPPASCRRHRRPTPAGNPTRRPDVDRRGRSTPAFARQLGSN